MPQIQQTKEGGVIIYSSDDFIGFASGYAASLYPKLGRGASWLSGVNPFLKGPGVLCPGLLGTALTGNSNIAATINNAVIERTSSVASAWLIEAGVKIHQIADIVTPYTISDTSPFPYTIGVYTFTVTSASATIGATYTNNSSTFTVLATIASETTLYMLRTSGTNAPDASGDLTKASGTGDATIAFSTRSASATGEDILTFNISGTEYVIYSYNNLVNGDAGRVTLPSTFDDDWFSTASGGAILNKNVPHPMIVGDDQKLYIADLATTGTLAKLWQVTDTGTIGSFTTIVPRNYIIRAFTKIGTHLVIFADKLKASATLARARGDAIALFWDYSASTASYIYQLNDNEVTAAFNWNGVVGCFTQGRAAEFANTGYRSKLQIFEGGRFTPKFNFSQVAPGYGGLDIVNNILCWNSGGVVYSYGSPYPDLPVRVNSINIGAGTSNGFLKALNGIEIYLSTGSALNNEVFKQADTFYASAAWNGLVAEPLFPAHTQGVIDYIEIGFYGSASSGRTLTLSLDFDYGNSTKTILDALVTVTAGTQILFRNKDTSNKSFPFFSAIKPKVSWATGSGTTDAPKISYLKIYYSNRAIKV